MSRLLKDFDFLNQRSELDEVIKGEEDCNDTYYIRCREFMSTRTGVQVAL